MKSLPALVSIALHWEAELSYEKRCVGQREEGKDGGEFAKAAEYQGWLKA